MEPFSITHSCERIAMTHFNVRNTVSLLPLHTHFPQWFTSCFLFFGAVWKSLGPLPHENTLQADLGVTHQRQSGKKSWNLVIGSSPLQRQNISTAGCNQSSLRAYAEIRVKAEDTVKESTEHFSSDANLLITIGNYIRLVSLLWSIKCMFYTLIMHQIQLRLQV